MRSTRKSGVNPVGRLVWLFNDKKVYSVALCLIVKKLLG